MTEATLLGVLGAIASTTSVILFFPQFLAIWKLRNDPMDLRGVPVARMVILWVQALLWIAYGFAIHQPWVSTPGIINTPFMVASIVIVWRAHRQVAKL